VNATGVSPLRYQWLKNGQAISGATDATYTIGRISANDAGAYLDGHAVSTNAISPDLGSLDTPEGFATNIGQDGNGHYTDNGTVGIADKSLV
jgi:hypothetical protein